MEEPDVTVSMPEEYRGEMKKKDAVHLLADTQSSNSPCLRQLIHPERYSSAYRLIKVTELVLWFICCLRKRTNSSTSDLEQARLYWIKDCQSHLQDDHRFTLWKRQLDLFVDESGIWRCGGRMSKSCLSSSAKNPILLDRSHYLTKLIVGDAHLHLLHDGVKKTLTQLCSEYWLVKGRQ